MPMRGRSSEPLLLSVVLCTRDRAGLLRGAIESLSRQTLDSTSYEVVVVDDGSEDDTRAAVTAFESRVRVRYSRQRHAGTASAKNHGVFFAQGRIVLFLHDDEVADARLLETHCRAQHSSRKHPSAVVGSARPDRSLADDPLVRFVSPAALHPAGGGSPEFARLTRGPASFPRAFLLEQGVFDARLGSGLEDPEIALRLMPRGLRLVDEPRAVSALVRRPAFMELCDRAYEEGRSLFELGQLHPEPAVMEWTGVTGALEAWPQMERTYAGVVETASALDRDVRARLEAGAPVAHPERVALERSTWAALQAIRAKGIADRAGEQRT